MPPLTDRQLAAGSPHVVAALVEEAVIWIEIQNKAMNRLVLTGAREIA